MRHSSFAELATPEATTIINRLYECYVIPLVLSEAQTVLHLEANDISAAASPLWYEGERAVAGALVGIRGSRGWIGGFGIVPEYRGRGLAKDLLKETLVAARAHGVKAIQLEVLVQNMPALRTYERGGFKTVRDLHSYRIDKSDVGSTGPRAAYRVAGDLILAPEAQAPCWQSEPESLERHAERLDAVVAGDSFAVFRHDGRVAQVVKARAQNGTALRRLGDAIFAEAGVETALLFNQEAGGDVDEAARAAGWRLAFAQHEMHREL